MANRRDWTAARAKVEAEGVCRACGTGGRLEAAHIIPRSINPTEANMDALGICPLCPNCHRDYDSHQLDLLPYLTVLEQSNAVIMASGIASADRIISGRKQTGYTLEQTGWHR